MAVELRLPVLLSRRLVVLTPGELATCKEDLAAQLKADRAHNQQVFRQAEALAAERDKHYERLRQELEGREDEIVTECSRIVALAEGSRDEAMERADAEARRADRLQAEQGGLRGELGERQQRLLDQARRSATAAAALEGRLRAALEAAALASAHAASLEEKRRQREAAAKEDDKLKIVAKSGLENYCFTMRHTLHEESLDQEAGKFQSDDDDNKLKVAAKNGVENYCSTMRHTLNEASVGQEAEKFQSEDDDNKLEIVAKSGVENYCTTMRHTLDEESMDHEAEKFQSEDDDNKLKTLANNGVENYCFARRHTLNEESMMGMLELEGGDLETIEKALLDTSDWLDKNQLAETDEPEAKQKELEGFVNAIMMKVSSSGPRCTWLVGQNQLAETDELESKLKEST